LTNPPPKVSVVIPVYDASRYIGDTLAAVFGQTFADYEVVVVNDGSRDAEELARALEPYRGRVVYLTQENRGASAARNAGLRAARGEYAAFLDADDLWLPNYLERQLRFLGERGVDLACANAEIFGDSADAGRTFMDAYMSDAPAAGEASFLELLSARRCLITSGVIVRRALVLEAGLFDEALRNAQDYDLWLRLANRKARLGFHREVLLRYRSRPDSLSGGAINMHLRDLHVLDKVERIYELAPQEREAAAAVIRVRKASLEFELGKLRLLDGDYAGARASFRNAGGFGGGWKPRAALLLARAAPRLMRALYARRLARKRQGS
jgi:glycosyltransferase involved in cell wall biosynthesis